MKLSRSAGYLAAFALSFAIYLIPLFHLEAGWLMLGTVLLQLRDVTAAGLAWVISALILQGLAFLFVLWLLSRPSWASVLAIIVAAPLFVFGANVVLLYWIPLLMLVERDAAPEIGSIEKLCSIPNAAIAQVRAGTDLGLVRAGEAWLTMGVGQSRALLKMPGCHLIAQDTHFDGMTIDAVAPGGSMVHRSMGGTLLYLGPDATGFKTLSQPAGVTYWAPILSDDGSAVVWLDRIPSESNGTAHRLHRRDLATGQEYVLSIDLPGREQIELLGAQSSDGPFTISKFRNAVFSIDRDGTVVRGPVSPQGIYNARWGFVWLDGGWVAWDGYREEGRSKIVWDFADRHGERTIPRGRRINALSVAADGHLIAVAISSNLRIGDIPSVVFVLRTDTGEEVYRRRLPVRITSAVAFLGSEYLAVTEMEAGQGSVGVYRIPPTGTVE